MRYMTVLIAMSFLVLMACASHSGGGRKPGHAKNRITAEEIEQFGVMHSARSIIESLRPVWLSSRGPSTLYERSNTSHPVVYHNGIYLGDIDQLYNIPTTGIYEIRYHTPSEAAIEVLTR